ncbi:MAG: hypothetical protein DYG89_08070 [Caldilinea sp. CFX5]|nr:hypothetical protein [Caldilinea sp. CFX5]
MAKQVTVTINRITVHNNGEGSGKGELYWTFDIDGKSFVELSAKEARKTNDGEVISINESRTVSKANNDRLVVSGAVYEKDWPSKDETVKFTDEYSASNGWGIGIHDVKRTNGKLDVTIRYEIENG